MHPDLRIDVQPDLDEPTLLLAFDGWNDAGEAATSALDFLNDAIRTVPLATIDPEEFYDFTVRRPAVSLHGEFGERAQRRIEWPANEFRYGSLDDERCVVIGVGVEPHLRWRRYCDAVLALAQSLDVRRVVLAGSYLADVVYSRPVLVTGISTHASAPHGADMDGSSYEGPTGIVGVLADRFERAGYEVSCLWAGLPHYISASPNPRGALALVQHLTRILGIRVDEAPLCGDAARFEERVANIVAQDSELSDYVKELKRREFAQ